MIADVQCCKRGAAAGRAAGLRRHPRLLRAGKNDETIVKLCAISDRAATTYRQRIDVRRFFQKRDWLPARALAEDLVRRQPDVARLQKALIATLSNMKRYDDTIVQACALYRSLRRRFTMLDALKVAYFYTGKIDDAVRYGQRALSCATPRPAATAAGRHNGADRTARLAKTSSRFRCGARRRFMPMGP